MNLNRSARILIVFAAALAFVFAGGAAYAAQTADVVYTNGNVYTVDQEFSKATAFAVKDGRFLYVGDDKGARAYVGSQTPVIDLCGKTALPGLIESHMHAAYIGNKLYPQTPDIRKEIGEWASVERMQMVIERCLETGEGMRRGPGEDWLVLKGWMADVWDPPVFHRKLIDEVAPDTPVFIYRYTHGSGCNTKALELAGIDGDTPDPEGGHIVKDDNGVPTGEFIEKAPKQLLELIPPERQRTDYEKSRNFVEGMKAAARSGITALQTASTTDMETLERRKNLAEADMLRIRVNDMVAFDTALELGEPMNVKDHYMVYSVKDFSDGALGSRGARLKEEYSDKPGYYGEWNIKGVDISLDELTAEKMEELFARMASELLFMGFNLRVHAIGDHANHVMINAYERALECTGVAPEDARFAIEHTQILLPGDKERLAELGIIASMQPLHATEDMHFAESRLGDRIKNAYIWSDLLDAGVTIAAGTDFPVSPYNPFYTLHAAVTRQDRNNKPEGGWFPEQAMTRKEALRAATNAGAYTMFMEDELGSIEEGKLADFVVIPVDYMKVPAEDIWKIEPDMTVVGGEVVYDAKLDGK